MSTTAVGASSRRGLGARVWGAVVAGWGVVTGLAPGARYQVTAQKDGAGCKVALAPGGGASASSAGVLRLRISDCVAR